MRYMQLSMYKENWKQCKNVFSIMSYLQTNRGARTDVTQSRMSSLGNVVKVAHREPLCLRYENNRIPHWESSKSYYDIITYTPSCFNVLLAQQ